MAPRIDRFDATSTATPVERPSSSMAALLFVPNNPSPPAPPVASRVVNGWPRTRVGPAGVYSWSGDPAWMHNATDKSVGVEMTLLVRRDRPGESAKPPMMTTAWRVDPTPWGESEVHHSLTLPGNHFSVFSTLVNAADRDRGAGTNVEQLVKTCADRRPGWQATGRCRLPFRVAPSKHVCFLSTKPTGSSVAWQRACFGSTRSWVQIPPPRPIAVAVTGPSARLFGKAWYGGARRTAWRSVAWSLHSRTDRALCNPSSGI